MRWLALASLLVACHDAPGETTTETTGETTGELLAPAEGRWRVDAGEELARTCVGDRLMIGPDREYVLTNTGEASFTLAAVEPILPDHACTRDGAEFDCPLVLVVGECTYARSLGFRGRFEGDRRAVGSIVYHFSCHSVPPPDEGTSSSGPEPLDCCEGFGPVNPCTIDLALVATWTSA